MADRVNSDGLIVMWSIGQIAERDGVSKAAVSKMVAKLVSEHNLPVRRDSRDRVAGVSIADYDHHRAFFGSSEQDQTPQVGTGAKGPTPNLPPSESRDEALRQEAWMRVRRQKLEDAKAAGQLVRADILAEALTVAGRTIQAEVARLQHRADDIALAVSKEGTSGARIALRKAAEEISNRIADALAKVAENAPEMDEAIEGIEE
ncbi:MAG: hypothetical protein P0Y65_20645 [Candidatus Devosia phytovorans]|uniref:Uncharacterized protein n=1 Tax=Candidatus Devosia phytovorans TaxID=3121372 RepID=A0AAJ6AZW0_9HYPH|nr:hypothetical protein [Devosia sp.]WEK04552.1 MAG: hypothetical protein P0Y65_20645 [Devosia sp.]